jgi:transcriptional regulator with XRE-family HTH domain
VWGLNKKRSKLGRWLDRQGYSQEDLMKASKVSRNTVSRLCSDPEYLPTATTIKKIMTAVRKLDPNKKVEDFFDM